MTDKTMLTEQDRMVLRKKIKSLERDSRLWPVVRWLLAIIMIMDISIAIYGYKIAKEYGAPVFDWGDKITLSDVADYSDILIASLRVEMVAYSLVLITVISGGVLMVFLIGFWNCHLYHATRARMLRMTLEQDSPA